MNFGANKESRPIHAMLRHTMGAVIGFFSQGRRERFVDATTKLAQLRTRWWVSGGITGPYTIIRPNAGGLADGLAG